MAERPSKRGRVKVEDGDDRVKVEDGDDLAAMQAQIAAMEATIARMEEREQLESTQASTHPRTIPVSQTDPTDPYLIPTRPRLICQ